MAGIRINSIETIKHEAIKKYIECFEKINVDGETRYACLIERCKSDYVDASGAIKHLRVNHTEYHTEIRNCNQLNNYPNADERLQLLQIRCEIKVQNIIDACVDLVTVNGMSLCCLDSSAFNTILKPYVIALGRQGIQLAINRTNIKHHIFQRTKKIIEMIKNNVKSKLICLMIDIASRYGRSILGVSIAYWMDEKVQINTIGMHTLTVSHTGRNIRSIIKENLIKFGIEIEQICGITTDMGTNVTKAAALLDNDLNEQLHQNNLVNNGETEQNLGANFEENQREEEYEDQYYDSDAEENQDIFDSDYYEDLLASVRDSFMDDITYGHLVENTSCGAHCFHLIVTQAIKACIDTKELVNSIRAVAKKLRTPIFQMMLDNEDLKHAIVDTETRWNSTFFMVSLKNKSIHSVIIIMLEFWFFL